MRKVIITAGAGGIGKVLAESFLGEGDSVAVCDASPETLTRFKADHPDVPAYRADVTDEPQVTAFMAQAQETLGGVDILVNTAGIAGPTGPLEELSLADWRACLAVTLDGSFLCSRAVIPAMKAQGSGLIVNLSSTAGLFGFARRSPYATAKWGVIGLTKTMASELGPHGIRVNAICPGSVEGERMDRVIAAEAKATGDSEETVRARYTKDSSLRRFIRPEEVAGMVLYLASPLGSAVSGQALAVDGNTESK